jgi:hypothetical protein
MAMITVPSPLGTLQLRPETDEDRAFRFHLFCESRPPELALLPLDAAARDTLMRFQFQAQTLSYRTQFPDARFDIIGFTPIETVPLYIELEWRAPPGKL